MVGEIIGYSLDNILLGFASFVGLFLILLFSWLFVIKILKNLTQKSKFYFIPQILGGTTPSFVFLAILVSLYFVILVWAKEIFEQPASKIILLLILFSAINLITRFILSIIDFHYAKNKNLRQSWIYRSLPLLKSTAGIILYSFALLISVVILSYEVGFVVILIAIVILAMLFIVFLDPLKNIAATTRLSFYVKEGMLIRLENGKIGFVEKIGGSHTRLRSLNEETIIVPNLKFLNSITAIAKNNTASILIKIKGNKDGREIKKRLSSISGKIAVKLSDIAEGSKPRVTFIGVENGCKIFKLAMRLNESAEGQRIIEEVCSELSNEFGNKLVEISGFEI